MSETTESRPAGFIPVPAEFESQAFEMLAGWAALHGYPDGEAFFRAVQADPAASANCVTVNDLLAILILTREAGLNGELLAIVVHPEYRGHDLGKLAMIDAVNKLGGRPLIVECTDELRGYFLKQGYRMVGKRKGPDGEWRYRLGAHSPRPEGEPDPLGRNKEQA